MNKEECLADEIVMIADGGEMPEVAFNSSLYYLTKDKDGPQLDLCDTDLFPLKLAVVQRFGVIIQRDLQPENRLKSLYRGLERSAVNWFRLVGYCQREQLSLQEMRQDVGLALVAFLLSEIVDVCEHGQVSCVNCTLAELQKYAQDLKVDLEQMVPGWQKLF